jgi:hypothetical protein
MAREGGALMGQRKTPGGQQALGRRQARNRRRFVWVSAPLAIAAVILVIALTSQEGYSGFDVIGDRPAIVQVYLPG